MNHITKFLADSSNDTMIIKGAIGLWAWLVAQADSLTAWDVWDRWYGVGAQIGGACVGIMMVLVLWSNYHKNRVETRNLQHAARREQISFDRLEEQREAAHQAAGAARDLCEEIQDQTEPSDNDLTNPRGPRKTGS